MDLAALRRWWPLAAVLVLLFVTSLAATRSQPQLDQIKPNSTATTPPPLLPTAQPSVTRAGAQPATPAQGLPDWVGTVAVVLLILVGLVALGVVITALIRDQAKRRARRGGKLKRRGANPPRTADELVAALDAGLEELSDADRDPRRAVIACWVRLEQAAAAAGTPRHPGDTPTDLVGRLLAEQQVDSAVLAALLEVYRQARYATHTVDDQMRRQAREALQRLRADLGAAVVSA
jgi:ABC-type transporter Mla MlaB component